MKIQPLLKHEDKEREININIYLDYQKEEMNRKNKNSILILTTGVRKHTLGTGHNTLNDRLVEQKKLFLEETIFLSFSLAHGVNFKHK